MSPGWARKLPAASDRLYSGGETVDVTLRYSLVPPWAEDEPTADCLWRVVVSTLGRECDQLWLRFGNLDDMANLLPPEQYLALEERIGPHWGQPDPVAVDRPGPVQSILGGLLPGIVEEFKHMGLGTGPASIRRPPPKYVPYGCAVVPLSRHQSRELP